MKYAAGIKHIKEIMENFGDFFDPSDPSSPYNPFGGPGPFHEPIPFDELKKMIQAPEPKPSFDSLVGMVAEAAVHFQKIYGHPPRSIGVSPQWMLHVRRECNLQHSVQMTEIGMICNVYGLSAHEAPNLRGIAVVLKEGM